MKSLIQNWMFCFKKKNLVHIAFERPLISYLNIEGYWNERKCFFKDYKMIYPSPNKADLHISRRTCLISI